MKFFSKILTQIAPNHSLFIPKQQIQPKDVQDMNENIFLPQSDFFDATYPTLDTLYFSIKKTCCKRKKYYHFAPTYVIIPDPEAQINGLLICELQIDIVMISPLQKNLMQLIRPWTRHIFRIKKHVETGKKSFRLYKVM